MGRAPTEAVLLAWRCGVRDDAARGQDASSVQPTGCDFSEGEAMAQTRFVNGTTTRDGGRRMPISQRLILVAIGLAIVLLALGGWAAQALRVTR
jgi:hypothetical protein